MKSPILPTCMCTSVTKLIHFILFTMYISFVQSTLRLAQLDKIAERLSRHVMDHHEEMGMSDQAVLFLYGKGHISIAFFFFFTFVFY